MSLIVSICQASCLGCILYLFVLYGGLDIDFILKKCAIELSLASSIHSVCRIRPLQ